MADLMPTFWQVTLGGGSWEPSSTATAPAGLTVTVTKKLPRAAPRICMVAAAKENAP